MNPEGDLREMPPREIVKGLMRGDPASFKAGYSADNAAMTACELHAIEPDSDEAVALMAYASGFGEGLAEGRGS